MPAVLSDKKICHGYVPRTWKPVLDGLVDFQRLEKQIRQEPSDGDRAALLERILVLHDRLVDQSAELLEPQSLDDMDESEIAAIFARAVFLLMRIASCVAADEDVLDTAGSRMLQLYEADFLAEFENQQVLRDALQRICQLNEQALRDIESTVSQDVRDATNKHLVVQAIRDQFGLWPGRSELRSGIFEFFDSLYPHVGIVEDEIELIVTGTMIFFCLPFEQDRLTTARFAQLSPEDQQPIRKFLTRVNRFSHWQFAHFPVFGFRRGEDLDRNLLEQLAQRCGIDADQVAREISTLTAIVPIQEVDKYVVHDIWGHSWQASMMHFDEIYQQLATFADPLSLEETATAPAGQHELSFADCFQGEGDDLRLNETRFRRFVDLEVAERLPIAMTPVLAEVLADVAEFKLLSTKATDHLPSSSLLKAFPAKLDLTIRDVTFYFRQATKVFRLWATRQARRELTVSELISRGGSPAAARRAVEVAANIWLELETEWMAPKLSFREDGELLRVNVMSRVALNFLAIHRETLLTYRRLEQKETGRLPLKGFRDLLLISVAVFFETSPSRNLWRVDEFLSLKIEPLCEQLASQS